MAIAKLTAEYGNLVSAGLRQYNNAIDEANAKSAVYGNQFDVLGAKIGAVKSAIDANIASQLASGEGFDINNEALQELIATLNRLDPLRQLRSEFEFVSSLTPQVAQRLKSLGHELASVSEAEQSLRDGIIKEIDRLENLEVQTEETTQQIKNLKLELAGLDASKIARETAKLENVLRSVLDIMSAVAGGLKSLFDVDFSSGNSIISGLQGIAGSLKAIPGPVGVVAGAFETGLGIVNSVIGDLSNGIAQVRKQIQELNADLNFIDVTSLVELERVSRGGIVGALGGKKTQIDEEASKVGLAIARQVDAGFSSGFKKGIETAISGGDTLKSLEEGLNDAVKSAMVEAIFQSLLVNGLLGAQITRFAEALAAGNLEAAKAIFEDIKTQLPALARDLDALFDDLDLGLTFGVDETSITEAFDFVSEEIGRAIGAALSEIDIDLGEQAGLINDLASLQFLAEDLKQTFKGIFDGEIELGDLPIEEVGKLVSDTQALIDGLAEAGIELTEEQLEIINEGLDKAKDALEAITGISKDSLANVFASSAGTTDGFLDSWSENLEATTRDAVIKAFVSSAAIQALLGDFSDALNAALADGILTEEELAGLEIYNTQLGEAGENLDKILERLGLIPEKTKEIVKVGGIKIEVDIKDEDISTADASLDQLFDAYDELQIDVSLGSPEAIAKAVDEIADEIKDRLGIAAEDFASEFGGVFKSATSEADFVKDWEQTIKDATRDALIAAFLESEVIKQGFEDISDLFFEALKDGVITPEEQAAIDQAVDKQTEAGREFFRLLEQAGLITSEAEDAAKSVAESVANIDEAFNLRQQLQLVQQTVEVLRSLGLSDSEIEIRLGIDLDQLEEDLEEAEDFIKSTLGTAASDFGSSFENALNNAKSPESFLKNWGEALEQTTKDAMIKAFINSAIVQASLENLSDIFTNALADGVIDASEQALIDAEAARLGALEIRVR